VPCAESLRVQAYFDAEVDALSASEIERHLEGCPECRDLLADLERTRTAIRENLPPRPAPPQLRARISRALDKESDTRPRRTGLAIPSLWRMRAFWTGALGGLGAAAIAATVTFLLLSPLLGSSELRDDLLSAHMRSLMPAHLIDVESSDRHTVKPWFAGHADVSPVVADFSPQGYRLLGGRADYLDHQRTAVVVYAHGPHIINVFSWTDARSKLPRNTTRNGYHMLYWRTGNLNYCAVSDTGWDELEGLVRLLQELSAHESSASM